MTVKLIDEARKDPRLNREIDLYGDELVNLADKTLAEERMRQLKTKLKLGQLSNLLNVALQSESVAPVNNWIQYQLGRKETREAWRLDGFGNAVLNDLKTMLAYAESISQELFDSDSPRLVGYVHIRLVRLYVGYLRRWFVARGGQN